MKLIIALFIFIVVIQCTESRHLGWLPQNLVEALKNKTSSIRSYVQSKGRSLKQFYVENVRNKITSYFNFDNVSEYENINEHQVIKKRQFKDYVQVAEAKKQKIFDVIAPEKVENRCSENDPSIRMTTPQLIASHGFVSESHTIVTEDGYILTVHRIPHSQNSSIKSIPRKTVLLHHGLLGSSADWILPGPEKGLGYILSEAGYDVWLANVRGNTYSRAHVTLNTDSYEFWNFTFHEVSQHDLPAVIDYIMDVKGWDVKINYIGHSMGTTVLFALLSTKTHYNKILRAGFALAPVAFMSDVRSPIHLLAKYSDNIEYLFKLLGTNEFLPQNSVLRWLSKHACEIDHYEEVICENSLFVLCGHDEKQFNRTLLPIILGHVPAGASTKTLVHYAQEIRNAGRFQQFDYGPEGNKKQYGTFSPPAYPLQKITLPIALYGAENDWLASDVDVTNLYVHLVNPIEHYIVPFKEFNHIDFMWGIDAPKLVFVELLKHLEEGVTSSYIDSDLSVNEI